MALSDILNSFGQHQIRRHGMRVHKLALDAGFTCPNRDGSKGVGGCTFCNNAAFSPNAGSGASLRQQMDEGRRIIRERVATPLFMAYFQAYTNTYADVGALETLYRTVLGEPDIVGLAVGTRPDCVPDAVLDLLVQLQTEGYDIWLELGLQSSFDRTLEQVNRGHTFAKYVDAVRRSRQRGLKVCTHLILGLPGEGPEEWHHSLAQVTELGVDGLKLHALHVVKGTQLANEWRQGRYRPMEFSDYVRHAAELIERTPESVVFHGIAGTAPRALLLAPEWCNWRWQIMNAIEQTLKERGSRQGCLASAAPMALASGYPA